MKQKHGLNSYMSLEPWIPLLEDNASNGFHSCFWGEWHLLQVYLVGSLIPSLSHCQPNVHFTGMWLSRNDTMCSDTSSVRGWWPRGMWFKNHFFIFTWWLQLALCSRRSRYCFCGLWFTCWLLSKWAWTNPYLLKPSVFTQLLGPLYQEDALTVLSRE